MSESIHHRIDDLVMWSCVPLYALCWSATLSHGYETEFLFGACFVSLLYLAGHVYEIKCRGHCYISADATAGPWSGLGVVSWVLWRWQVAGEALGDAALDLLPWFALAFMGSHVVVLMNAGVWTAVLKLATRLRRR